MVRFSCFQAHIPHRPKRTIQLSAEVMKLEDVPQNQSLQNFYCSKADNKSCLKEEENTLNYNADQATDSSPAEFNCKSKEIESEYHTDSADVVHNNSQIKKSQSLGSQLYREGITSSADGSEGEMEHRFSHDGSSVHTGALVPDGTHAQEGTPSNYFQEPVPSDSVGVNSDFAKNESIFSIGDPQRSEMEAADKDILSTGSGDSSDLARNPPVMVKSSSLPGLCSPNQLSPSFLARSRSSEDLNALDSRKNGILHEVGIRLQNERRDNDICNIEKNDADIPGDDTHEHYNYIGSAKDWIIPVPDGVNEERLLKGETSLHHWDDERSNDFRLNRIKDWVTDLQHCSTLEESDKYDPCHCDDLLKGKALLEESAAAKVDVKANTAMEAAKKYISSLNASATAAQLTNLGLVVIPFLGAFASLKSFNLSGNGIVRITAGALPRGLHVLNLSKNKISTIEGLRELTRLRVLDLSYNRILRIGHGLVACSSIKELYLAGNKISEVEGLHRLLKLNVLDLRFNKISTSKSLGQLAANYNCLQALSLEGNPAQKNVGDEQLKKYVQNLLPRLAYYNRHPIKVRGTMKDTAADRSTRFGVQTEAKTLMRKDVHSIVAQQEVPSSSILGRKNRVVASSQKPSSGSSRHGRLPPSGMKTTNLGRQWAEISSKLPSFRTALSIRRSRSEGTLDSSSKRTSEI